MEKSNKRIYLSGPITGIADYHQRFEWAKSRLEAAGHYDIVNPAELDKVIQRGSYEEYMKICLMLIDGCTDMVMLPGWESSLGANREYGYAKALLMPIHRLEQF